MYGKVILVRKVVSINSIRYYSTKKLLEFLAKMPKENYEKSDKRIYKQTPKLQEKAVPSTVYLQVIGSGARGAPNTLYLFTDQNRYLFNCGEGTQRLAHEHKVKLSKLSDVFITNKTWQNIGGLPGLSLTLQDVGIPQLTLHGPKGLDELYEATERFITMKNLYIRTAACSPSEDFEDNVMTVKYVKLGPEEKILNADSTHIAKKPKLDEIPISKKFEQYINDDTDYYWKENYGVGFRQRSSLKLQVFDNEPLKTRRNLLNNFQKQSHYTVAYICTLKKRLGTLVLEKCVEMGVKPGPLLGQLKNGYDVVLPDGRIVRSQDVKTPDDPGPVFIVLEVPEISYLKESEFSSHFDNGKNPPENIPAIVVHFTPPNVFIDPKYRSFMSKFGPTTRHLVLNEQNSCLGSEAVHRTQHRLHLLDERMFPLLRDASLPPLWKSIPENEEVGAIGGKVIEELKNKIAAAQFQSIISMEGSSGDGELKDSELDLIAGRTLTMIHLRPKKCVDRSAEPKLHIQEYIQEVMDVEGFAESLEQFKKLIGELRDTKVEKNKYPRVVFLGTGSCIPSKTRNTSAIVLHVNETSSILFDCGEGTFGQLVRFYGPNKVNSFLRTLKAIYVSHLHADHHIGLFGVLQERKEAFEEMSSTVPTTPVYLFAPGQIVTWLSVYDRRFENICDEFTLIPNQSLLPERAQNSELTPAILTNIGIDSIRTCYVSHCPNAFGVTVDLDPRHRITYSGDTIPCNDLVKLGKDSTILIHEATMEDELENEARYKMHSTTSQAIDIAKQMNAKYTILTHFSQRYARLPRLNSDIMNADNTVGIAFDNMQVTIDDLDLLSHIYKPLQLMFAEHCMELEIKAAHRAKLKGIRSNTPDFPSSSVIRNYSTLNIAQDSENSNGSADVIVETEKNAVRKRSPSVTSRVSAQYRDSIASRLRHDRYRSLSSDGKTGGRSKSCSPIKNSSKPKVTKRSPSSGSQPKSPERAMQVLPHTALPNFKRKDPRDNVDKPFNIVPLVDTQSKTINKLPSRANNSNIRNNTNCKISNFQKEAIQLSLSDTKPSTVQARTKFLTPDSKCNTLRQKISSRSPSVGNEKSPTRGVRSRIISVENQKTRKENTLPPKIVTPNERGANQRRIPINNVPSGYRGKVSGIRIGANTRPDAKNSIPKTIPSTKHSYQAAIQRRNIINSRKSVLDRKNEVANYSNKSFKPQLEDIKSSYLLLNKKNITCGQGKKEFEKNLISNLQSICNKQRKEHLDEVKQKFKTKKYLNDSKYERIEGLNWITWK